MPPYLHTRCKHASCAASAPATNAQTLFNYINVIMGAGFVSIPFACRAGGWAALALLWALGIAFAYTGLIVLSAARRVAADRAARAALPPAAAAARPPAGYEECAEAAFGSLGRRIVSLIMYAELLGICTVYIVLEAEALAALLGAAKGGAAATLVDTARAALPAGANPFIALASAVVVPTVLLPDLAALSSLGALSVASALAIGASLAALLAAKAAAAGSLAAAAAGTVAAAPAALPQALGVCAFVYAGHSTFSVVQQSMARPAEAPRVMVLAYACVVAICTLVGAAGYACYGAATADVITANLPAGTLVAAACTALTAVSPFAAFALTLEPVALAAQRALAGAQQQRAQGTAGASSSNGGGVKGDGEAGQPPYPVRAAIRLALACGCAAAAASLPYAADVMGLVGALLTMSVSLIIPGLMQLALGGEGSSGGGGSSKQNGGRLPLAQQQLAGSAAVVALGIVCAVAGARSAWGSLQAKLAAAAASAVPA